MQLAYGCGGPKRFYGHRRHGSRPHVGDGGPGNLIKLEYAGSDAIIEPTSTGGYQTVRPTEGGSGSGEFIYLSYGVQTVTLRIKAGNGATTDWFRFIPVDPYSEFGLPLPYPTVTPAISQFGATTIQAENFDKGGVNIAYNDEWGWQRAFHVPE